MRRQIAAVLDCKVSAIDWNQKRTDLPLFEKIRILNNDETEIVHVIIDTLLKRRNICLTK